jgi:Uma2 family endonuclease
MNYSTHLSPIPQAHRVTVFEWHKMGEYQVFEPDARIELLNGGMIEMAPIGPFHGGCVKTLIHLLSRQMAGAALLSVQDPIQLSDLSEPQPDLALLHLVSHFYRQKHPTAADIFLVIEVADSSAKHDRETKIPLYGRHGIIECWLVDLMAKQVEVYRQPTAQEYAEKRVLRSGDLLSPSQLPQIQIAVSELFD